VVKQAADAVTHDLVDDGDQRAHDVQPTRTPGLARPRRDAMSAPAMSDPFFEVIPLCAALAFACWLLSVLTREYSWVDRLWSVAPPLYLWLMAWRDAFSDARLLLMTGLATLWGVRLTYNFARKGGYRRGGEDYRERFGPVWFQVFNVVFIAPVQNVVLLLITAAASPVWLAHSPLTALDALLGLLFMLCLIGETVADEQQWRFQQAKAARRARGEAGPSFSPRGSFACRVTRTTSSSWRCGGWSMASRSSPPGGGCSGPSQGPCC
jgi:Protein of unknown function (DUF1295)